MMELDERIEAYSGLIERCEHGSDVPEILNEVLEFLGAGEERDFVVRNFISARAFLDAANAMLPKPGVWRAYTDHSVSVYGASPWNAKAQVAYAGYNQTSRSLAISAGLLKMLVAPLLKEQAKLLRAAEIAELKSA